MSDKVYYSTRIGKVTETPEIAWKILKIKFMTFYDELKWLGYFQKYFGCNLRHMSELEGHIRGEIADVYNKILFDTKKEKNLWPLKDRIEEYSEDDLFDMVEFTFNHCSKPNRMAGTCENPDEGYYGYHDNNDYGNHYQGFDDIEGKKYYRENINVMLKKYKSGYELSENGEILELPEKYMENIFEATIPSNDQENINKRVEAAVLKFRRHKSSIDDRRDAVRELADVLEFLRKDIKIVFKDEENDLFNIANNFGLRHHNAKQKVDYDKSIWYSWMFYYYLATIHAVLRLIEKKEKETTKM